MTPTELILGPPVALGDNYFDKTLVALARQHGEACPTTPPTDDTGLDKFVLLHYYDLPLVEYITHSRTQDPFFLELARKCADAWASHPGWIGDGKIQLWPDNAAPPPRHAGIPGLILRALDDRRDLWHWINGYTDYFSEIYVKRLERVNAPLQTNPREAAFTLQAKAYLSVVLPDSFPTPTGTRSDGAAIRASYIADLEAAARYYASKQRDDGAWVWDEDFAESDGGLLRGIMQPFIVGLLLQALCDMYEVVGAATKEIVKTQILKGCRHLYEGGPYIKDQIEQVSGKRVRGFHYYYHGGTTVNPTRYADGDIKFPWTAVEAWWVPGARQAISMILPPFGWAFDKTGDEFYKLAGDEMFDSAYNGTDGMRALMDSSAKNFNQHARGVSKYLAWRGGVIVAPPVPDPIPVPDPPKPPTPPVPPPPVEPPPAGSVPVVTLTTPANAAVLSGKTTVTATVTDEPNEVYLIVDDVVKMAAFTSPYEFELDTTRLSDGTHSLYVRAWKGSIPGDSQKISVVVKNAVEPPVEPPVPTPDPVPQPPPTPTPKCSIIASPTSLNLRRNNGGTITVTLQDLSEPTVVEVDGSDGQVTVTPTTWSANATSSQKQFSVRAKNKRQSRTITFRSSCGSATVTINVT